jgi:putative membrane protein
MTIAWKSGRILRVAMAATVVTALGACTSGERDRAAAEVDTAAGQIGEAAGRAGSALGTAVDSVAGRIAGREYTNGELVGFINGYNDAEIEIGGLARTKATDPEVRQFAQRIVTEHRALKTEATSTARRLNITPVMPAADEGLQGDHREGMRDFNQRARGSEFDEAFVEHEVRMHRNVLDEIEDALGRKRNEEIRPLLERARDGVRGHLTRAEELEKKFGAT